MTVWQLIRRSLVFYRRTHLAVVIGTAIAGGVLTGAVIVGDSVRYSLKTMALQRLGNTQLALHTPDRRFRAALANDLDRSLDTATAAVLDLSAIAITENQRVGHVHALGIDQRFEDIMGESVCPSDDDSVVLNEHLASRLGARVNDTVLFRIARPSALPRDAVIGSESDASIALRLRVINIIDERFSLTANQIPPLNAFVSVQMLQQRLDMPGRANMILVGGDGNIDTANRAIHEDWQLADAGLELHTLPNQNVLELRTERVFLEPSVQAAARQTGVLKVLTYFVNEIRLGQRTTPYSFVTAMGPIDATVPHPLVVDLADDEILINRWLADDLQAKAGNTIDLTYFALGRQHQLEERTASFRIGGIVATRDSAADPHWTPDFPGLADSDNCRDWKPPIPIDLAKIRDQDEQYWQQYRTTPKAFITLNTGQSIWRNRFGQLTSIRYSNGPDAKEKITTAIRSNLDPKSLGLFFQPVREQALAAGAQAVDFGSLFLGLSFFLIVAALLLTGLLFALGIEQRTGQIGTLLAIGYRPATVRLLMMLEAGLLAIAGSGLGIGLGTFYTKLVLLSLATVWQDAVAAATIEYHAGFAGMALGFVANTCAAWLVMWWHLHKLTRREPHALIAAGTAVCPTASVPSRRGLFLAVPTAVAGVAVIVIKGDPSSVAAFFVGGTLLLIAGLGWSHWQLSAPSRSHNDSLLTLSKLGSRNASRRRSRSLAVVILLACGSFLVVAIGANRHDPTADAHKRSSGTGGFALMADATFPILHDLNTDAGRKAYNLERLRMRDVSVVPLRVRPGDDASCLNLNRAQAPQLLGIDPDALASRNAFTFVKGTEWRQLGNDASADVVPAIGDQATVVWGLGKTLGDEIAYTDESGQAFRVRIVGIIANSILQGNLIISERAFIRKFPSHAGYHRLLIDAPFLRAETLADYMSDRMQNVGLDITSTAQRLAQFSAVEHTYLAIFQALGGLGLLLGAAGLGLIVMRNVLERRSELALLQAVGFTKRTVTRLLLIEHAGLLLMGLISGGVAGFVAVLPVIRSPGAGIPLVSMAITLIVIIAAGLMAIILATRIALRGRLVAALVEE